MWHQLAHWLGMDDPSGGQYLWWSGAGSDLAYVGALTLAFRRLNCHHHKCLRLGLHHVDRDGHRYSVCRKHGGVNKLGKADAS